MISFYTFPPYASESRCLLSGNQRQLSLRSCFIFSQKCLFLSSPCLFVPLASAFHVSLFLQYLATPTATRLYREALRAPWETGVGCTQGGTVGWEVPAVSSGDPHASDATVSSLGLVSLSVEEPARLLPGQHEPITRQQPEVKHGSGPLLNGVALSAVGSLVPSGAGLIRLLQAPRIHVPQA